MLRQWRCNSGADCGGADGRLQEACVATGRGRQVREAEADHGGCALLAGGAHQKLGDLDLYVVEPPINKSPKEAVIVVYDIVGYGALQNFQAADYIRWVRRPARRVPRIQLNSIPELQLVA